MTLVRMRFEISLWGICALLARSRMRIAKAVWSRAVLFRYQAARMNWASRHDRTVLTWKVS